MPGWRDPQHKQEKAVGQVSFASLSKFLGHYSPVSANRSLPGLKPKNPLPFRGRGQVSWAA